MAASTPEPSSALPSLPSHSRDFVLEQASKDLESRGKWFNASVSLLPLCLVKVERWWLMCLTELWGQMANKNPSKSTLNTKQFYMKHAVTWWYSLRMLSRQLVDFGNVLDIIKTWVTMFSRNILHSWLRWETLPTYLDPPYRFFYGRKNVAWLGWVAWHQCQGNMVSQVKKKKKPRPVLSTLIDFSTNITVLCPLDFF